MLQEEVDWAVVAGHIACAAGDAQNSCSSHFVAPFLNRPGVPRVQASQLRDDQEQEEDDRAPADEEVLQLVPDAHRAQGNQVGQ
jgi:hypothetical protein